MKRNFPDFITAYTDYARDNYCPEHFHKWIGISLCAAVLERKVTLQQGIIRHFPNLYVMLVSHPGVGKSTAINRGVDLLNMLRKDYHSMIRIIPNQTTEAAMIEKMKIVEYFPMAEGRIQVPQSAGFFYADEASASALQNVCGDFVAAMTQFYDCPQFFRKATVGRGEVEIENVCMNMLSGSTFNYLKELVNERSVMGGFASRLLYIVSKDKVVREASWDVKDTRDYDYRNKLIEDLDKIHKLAGPMETTKDFKKCFEKYQPEFDRERFALNSEKHESILARKMTNLIKVAMICSISESDDLVVTGEHFERAKELIDVATADNALIISRAVMEQRDTQSGVNEALRVFIMEDDNKITIKRLREKILAHGSDLRIFDHTITTMIESGILHVTKGKLSFVLDSE